MLPQQDLTAGTTGPEYRLHGVLADCHRITCAQSRGATSARDEIGYLEWGSGLSG